METKPKLLATVGIAASGKSTFARELESQGWVRVEKDEIRLDKRLFPKGYRWPQDESKVVRERDRLIKKALREGKNVVSSDTNLNPQHIRQLMNIAQECDATFSVDNSFLSVPLGTLIERDRQRGQNGGVSVGENVIREQFHKYVKKMPTFVEWNDELPPCIISDIDGTLTLGPKKRNAYDWHKVGNDDINLGTSYILDAVAHMNANLDPEHRTKVFIFSGRSDICRPETEEWLERHDVEYDELIMRPHARLGEKDFVIKREMFEEHIRGKYNVVFILDDRPQVCRMWRDVYGLNVLNVGDPYYSF